ncbi:MAG TPA: hypothetical protein DEO40_02705 [Treponema sp.]|nr:hypothetical protein [Treponema sp.]
MKQFDRKTEIIIVAATVLALVLGSAMLFVSFGELLVPLIQKIFAANGWMRKISQYAWMLENYKSFLLILVIVVQVFLFRFLSDRSKSILLYTLFALSMVMIFFAQYKSTYSSMNSDMAGEMMLWKECAAGKAPILRSWFYSTELRLINTQLIGAPLMALFSGNWALVKSLVSVIALCILFCVSMIFMRTLGVEKKWLRILSSILIVFPFSSGIWQIVTWGNYYIPHIIFMFVYLIFFIKANEESGRRKKLFTLVFYSVAFLAGLSGIRYLMVFTVPLAVSETVRAVVKVIKKDGRFISASLKAERNSMLALSGMIFSGLGYVFYAVVFGHFFSVSLYLGSRFKSFGEYGLKDVFLELFNQWGYRAPALIFSPSGVVDCLVYAALILFAFFFIQSFKDFDSERFTGFRAFFISSFCVNSFFIMNIEFAGRYFIPVIILFIPFLALYFSQKEHAYKRNVLFAIWVVMILSSSFITIQGAFDSHPGSMQEIADFLKEKKYTFGYGTFWNANVFTAMTDGEIEVSNISTDDNSPELPEHYSHYKWLQPLRYEDPEYRSGIPVFMILSLKEYESSRNLKVIQMGKEVFRNSTHIIFEYADRKAFEDNY